MRLTLPQMAEAFSFMYSIDDPAGQSALSGGAAQILGPGEQYLCTWLPDVNTFWAWPHRLGLGHWQTTESDDKARYLSPTAFFETVSCGYQLTATQHQGCLTEPETGAIARWDYEIEPIYGWGRRGGPPLPTAGWLSYLPIFEPGWQVLMAHGLATGWVEWQGQRYEFRHAPTYMEKNWGGAFPQRWFWIQANTFESHPDLTITAVGGQRQVLGRAETVGLVGIHFAGQRIALSSLDATVAWQVTTWGSWQMTATKHRYHVILQGSTERSPTQVRVPTREGLRFECWDTTHGNLTVQIWERSPKNDQRRSLLLQATTSLAALEIGGQGWQQDWTFNQLEI